MQQKLSMYHKHKKVATDSLTPIYRLSSVADPEGVQGVRWTPSNALVFKYGMKMKSKPTPNTYEPLDSSLENCVSR